MRTLPRSCKTAPAGLLGALCLLAAAACGTGSGGETARRQPAGPAAREASPRLEASPRPEDWGTDPEASPGGRQTGAPAVAATGSSGTVWTIALATFPPGTDPQVPQSLMSRLRGLAPTLSDVWLHRSTDGALVALGHYDSPGSDAAQAELQEVKKLTIGNVPAFPHAMLTRVKLGPSAADLRPFSLMSARRQHPNVDPLYTLEVAVWGDFESGKLTLGDIHKQAESYATKLRAQGFEAYFYHDDDKRLSTVTVGLFDRRALDSRTGFYSAAVDALMEHFPAHLVNGEQLLEPIDGRDPTHGTRVQRPMLVFVPKE
jgi:hypothetical protein